MLEDSYDYIWVGRIATHLQETHLYEYFSQFGNVKSVGFLRSTSEGSLHPLAMIKISKEAVPEILKNLYHMVCGAKVNVFGVKRKAVRSSQLDTRILVVKGLARTTTLSSIVNYFSIFGEVAESEIHFDMNCKENVGFSKLIFREKDTIDRILEGKQGAHILDGQVLRLLTITHTPEFQQVVDCLRSDPRSQSNVTIQTSKPLPQKVTDIIVKDSKEDDIEILQNNLWSRLVEHNKESLSSLLVYKGRQVLGGFCNFKIKREKTFDLTLNQPFRKTLKFVYRRGYEPMKNNLPRSKVSQNFIAKDKLGKYKLSKNRLGQLKEFGLLIDQKPV